MGGKTSMMACAALALLLSACGSSDDGSGGGSGGAGGGSGGAGGGPSTTRALFVVPDDVSELADESFFDHPWPSDLRVEADGTVRFEGYPNPSGLPIINDYISSMAGVQRGFSPVAAGFLRFDGPIDESSLPSDPLAATEPDASVQLVNVDPESPGLGERHVVRLHWREEAGVYWQPNTLAVMPIMGYPLLPDTRYALVATDALRAPDGSSVGRSADLDAVLAGTLADWSDAIDQLESAGVARSSIAHLSVFTTSDPVADTAKLRDWIVNEYAAPDVTPGSWTSSGEVAGVLDLYEGEYGPSPDFQRGDLPFASFGDGGELAFDASGEPELQREFSLRFALGVPKAASCPMPAAGYPIVLYAHGTGGNYKSALRSANDEGPALAQQCIATMGIDQIFHGTRPGSDGGNVEILFFNVQNPVAARANGPQSALDVVQQARLFTETKITVPSSVTVDSREIRFDPDRVMFYGHSQGGLNGPMFLAIDDQARGGVFSGSAGMMSITLLEKTAPVDVAALVRTVFLGLIRPEEAAELNELHPMISLAQTIVDPTDPIHYAPMILQRPRAGFSPKSAFMTEGTDSSGKGDTYTPPHGIEVQAIALGLPPQQPLIHPIEELQWGPLAPVAVPAGGLSGNLAGGSASGVLAQWEPPPGTDGHFVIYNVPDAMTQTAVFLRSLADDSVGRVPAP